MTQYRKLNTLLSDQSNELHSLVRHAQFLARSNRILQSLLIAPLRKHVSIANISNQTLIITIDSAAWMTKTKLQLPDIFEKFKKISGLPQLRHTQIKVDPSNVYASYCQKANNSSEKADDTRQNSASLSDSLSAKTFSQISHVANNLNDDKLKKSLLKLAKTLAEMQQLKGQ